MFTSWVKEPWEGVLDKKSWRTTLTPTAGGQAPDLILQELLGGADDQQNKANKQNAIKGG